MPPSPNHGPRPPGMRPRMIVLHYTGMRTGDEARARLCDPASGVSAHYLVWEDGRVEALVDEPRRAWHAGRGGWRGESDMNSASIGIEIVHPGHEWGYRPFPRAQMDAVIALTARIAARWRIDPRDILGHSDMAPDRKTDPGELFDWPRLACAGLAVPIGRDRRRPLRPATARRLLAEIGYPVAAAGLRSSVIAFQRRIGRRRIDGRLDAETSGALTAAARAFRRKP